MDYQDQSSHRSIPARPNGFATASLFLGIAALPISFTMTLLPAVFCAAMAVILGLLSRGKQKNMHSNALLGVITGGSALAINFALAVLSFYMVFSDPDMTAQYWNMMNETYEQMTGMTLEEIMESYGGDL